MKEQQAKRRLRQMLVARQAAQAPGFEATLAVAERRLQRTRQRRLTAGIAASAAIVASAILMWPSGKMPQPDEYLSERALFGSTAWVAPSDVLLPRYEIDFYRDLPVLHEFNELQEGILL